MVRITGAVALVAVSLATASAVSGLTPTPALKAYITSAQTLAVNVNACGHGLNASRCRLARLHAYGLEAQKVIPILASGSGHGSAPCRARAERLVEAVSSSTDAADRVIEVLRTGAAPSGSAARAAWSGLSLSAALAAHEVSLYREACLP